MRTIAINPVKRKAKKMAASKRKTKSKTPARRAPSRAKANPAPRRRKSNPKAGLSSADMKDLGTSAIGGATAGAVTAYLEDSKPAFLAQVPLEIVSAGLGVALAMFGKTPAMKNISRGMVSYAAGRMAERLASEAKADVVDPGGIVDPTQTAGLVFANPSHYGSMSFYRIS